MQVRIWEFFRTERTLDEAAAFFNKGPLAGLWIEALVDDHTLSKRMERFISFNGSIQIISQYRFTSTAAEPILKYLRGRTVKEKKPEPAEENSVEGLAKKLRLEPDLVRYVVDAIGEFRMDADILTSDIRFSSKCDGVDISCIPPYKLTKILYFRCEPTPEKGAGGRTIWKRKW